MSQQQRCILCDQPTGRCAEDRFSKVDPSTGDEIGPLCEECFDAPLEDGDTLHVKTWGLP